MENLLAKDPTINVVHTINEPAAAGAYEALKAIGRENDVLIVSVDGGCPGVKNVADGMIGATSQQYPLLMAALGIEADEELGRQRREARKYDRRQGLLTIPALHWSPTSRPKAVSSRSMLPRGTELCWG